MYQIIFISLFLLILMLLLPALSKALGRRPRALLVGKVCLLLIYLYGNLSLTLLSRTVKADRTAELTLFWSYAEMLQGNEEIGVQLILNILLYIPLGYLLRFLFPQSRVWPVILAGCLLSACTEAIQFFFQLGLCEFDDIFNNTLGTVIGMVCHQKAFSLYNKGADKCRKTDRE